MQISCHLAGKWTINPAKEEEAAEENMRRWLTKFKNWKDSLSCVADEVEEENNLRTTRDETLNSLLRGSHAFEAQEEESVEAVNKVGLCLSLCVYQQCEGHDRV